MSAASPKTIRAHERVARPKPVKEDALLAGLRVMAQQTPSSKTWHLADAAKVAATGEAKFLRNYMMDRVRSLPGWGGCAVSIDFCGNDAITRKHIRAVIEYAIAYREWELATGVRS